MASRHNKFLRQQASRIAAEYHTPLTTPGVEVPRRDINFAAKVLFTIKRVK